MWQPRAYPEGPRGHAPKGPQLVKTSKSVGKREDFGYDIRRTFCLLYVVDVDTVCLFKTRLDKFWMHQDVMYDFAADLTGIGDRSLREIS